MKLSNVQTALYNYLAEKPIFVLLMNFSMILVLVKPCLAIISMIPVLNVISNIFSYISVITYIAYFLGLILCFAKKEMIFISIAFGLKALVEFIDLFRYHYSFFSLINHILFVLFYLALVYLAFNSMKKD